MLFNSLQFLVFFPMVTIFYYLFPPNRRWILLLISSCIFYMAFIPPYILIIFTLILVDYFAGMAIEKAKGDKRKAFLILSIFTNIGMLSIFKYFNFFSSNINYLLELVNVHMSSPHFSLLLPLGLSFHVFQSLSYTIEVFRKKQKAEKHLGYYALYVLFYPQLVAGPIERPYNLLPQLHRGHRFNEKNFFGGLKLMLWGFFKKMVIADRLANLINPIYGNPANFSGSTLLIATYLFAFQIYCDFSGYTDIAIGASQVMGIKIMNNFDRPYFSKSIAEFWTRWHISLSSWFRDYLYIPLGGNRVKKLRWVANILIIFLISGLWHGADWKFVLWGALHGTFIVLTEITHNVRQKLLAFLKMSQKIHNFLAVLITFNLTAFAWIFFRASSIHDGLLIVKLIATDLFKPESLKLELLLPILLIIFMETVSYLEKGNKIRDMFGRKPLIFRWAFYYLLIFAIIFLGVFGTNKFIYFQF